MFKDFELFSSQYTDFIDSEEEFNITTQVDVKDADITDVDVTDD